MNTQEYGLKPGQELFEGDYRTKMAELREAGYTPWSTENYMDARNEVPAKHPRWNNFIDTDFGIAESKKKIYVMPHSARLRAVTPKTRLTDGGIPMGMDAFDEAKIYARSDLILDRNLTEKEARASPVWLNFAAGDQKRLDTYVKNTFRFGKDKFKYDTMMGIFILEDEAERAVVLGRLGYRYQAYGVHLCSGTRFVGVRK